MKEKIPLYFIGWDYHTPQSVSLKRLLAHPESPWQPMAIIHDETWVSSVDGIALMRTREFLEICKKEKNINAVILLKDTIQNALWLRKSKEYRFSLIDEGEIFQITSKYLEHQKKEIDINLINLPISKNDSHINELSNKIDILKDSISRDTLKAYIQFVETGLLDKLRKIVKHEIDHPLLAIDGWMKSIPWGRSMNSALAWEVAPQRTSFLEQSLLLSNANIKNWSYALSSNNYQEDQHLCTLMRPFGIKPIISSISSNCIQIPQSNQTDSDQKYDLIVTKIDIADPGPILQFLRDYGTKVYINVRLGRSVQQLADFLKNFGHTNLTLHCDRPGPMGLFARLSL